MRRRKVKGADEKLLSYKDYVVRDNIESLKGNWNQLFKMIILYMQSSVLVEVNF